MATHELPAEVRDRLLNPGEQGPAKRIYDPSAAPEAPGWDPYADDPPDYADETARGRLVERADYHLRRSQAAADAWQEHDAVFAQQIEAMQARRDHLKAQYEREIGWHARACEAAHRRLVADFKGKKTLHLPSGVVALKAAGELAIEVEDEEAFRGWLAGQPTEDGEKWEDVVYRRPPPKPVQFYVSTFRSLVDELDDRGEPGSAVRVGRAGVEAPGVRATVKADSWRVVE